jgi:hypothetical protein
VIDGICVESVEATNSQIIAVMVENHFEAWPQSGIASARVVYEAPVEGNITRFLLLYTEDQEVPKVGPVRSARPYYLDWLAEYGTPLYMHVGGSPDALTRISEEGVHDLNEFSRGWYYWRDTNRYAPHNVYTSSELWSDALETYDKQYTKKIFDGWNFGVVPMCVEDCVTQIEIVYSGKTYTAGWQYNTTTKQYTRRQAGEAATDSTGTPILADTIMVQYVDTKVLDAVGRLQMNTIGSGDSIVFQKGHAIEGKWQKSARDSRTRFYDSGGTEVVLSPGKIWVQIINRDTVTFE